MLAGPIALTQTINPLSTASYGELTISTKVADGYVYAESRLTGNQHSPVVQEMIIKANPALSATKLESIQYVTEAFHDAIRATIDAWDGDGRAIYGIAAVNIARAGIRVEKFGALNGLECFDQESTAVIASDVCRLHTILETANVSSKDCVIQQGPNKILFFKSPYSIVH